MGHQVFVVTTNLPGRKQIEREGNVIRIPGIVLKRLYSYRMARPFSKKAYDILKDIPLDLIHVQTEYGIGMFGRIVAWIRNIPLVYTYHSLYVDFTQTIAKGNKVVNSALVRLVTFLSKDLAEGPAEFTTPSLKTAEALRSYGVNRYINIIPNGIDMSRFNPTAASRARAQDFRREYGLMGMKVLSVVGRVGQEKGIDFLLRCLRRYVDETLDEKVRLLIVGDGPYMPQIRELVDHLWLSNFVIFTGRIPFERISEVYQASDALLTGSRSETQGLTVNEAMASRCPVLARCDPSFAQSVRDGETGFFFWDENTFTMRLKQIFSMDDQAREQMLDKAQSENEEKFSPLRFAKEMEHVYKKALRRYW